MPRFVPIQFCNLPKPPPRVELVEGLIALGEVVFFTGEPGTGKTAVAVHLAEAISNGTQFLGRDIIEGDVIYFAAERQLSVRRRLHASKFNSKKVWFIESTIEIIKDIDELINDIKSTNSNPKLMIIDTFARTIIGLDENTSKEMGNVMNAFDRLHKAFPNTAIVILHHTTKGNGSIRGSSAISGAIDLELRATKNKNGRVLRAAKTNDIEEGLIAPYTLTPHTTSEGEVVVQASMPIISNTNVSQHETNKKRAQKSLEKVKRIYAEMPESVSISHKDLVIIMEKVGIFTGCKEASRPSIIARNIKRLVDNHLIKETSGTFKRLKHTSTVLNTP